MNKQHAKYAMALIAALMAGQAAAHGMWTEERRGNIEVIYGHALKTTPSTRRKSQAPGLPTTMAVESLSRSSGSRTMRASSRWSPPRCSAWR